MVPGVFVALPVGIGGITDTFWFYACTQYLIWAFAVSVATGLLVFLGRHIPGKNNRQGHFAMPQACKNAHLLHPKINEIGHERASHGSPRADIK